MQLHPTLEKFYLSVLDYAGLQYVNGIIANVSDKIGPIQVDGKSLTLPYYDNLCNPAERHIFHPLNENYASPETAFLAIYKKRLTLEINMKISTLFVGLITLAADVHLQKKVKSPKLIELLSELGEVDITTVEHLITIVKHSQKANEEGFLVDFHVKKNGTIGETPYAAIGKVNFNLYNELNRALQDKEDGYRVYGYKTRKKDILTLLNCFTAVFKDIDSKTEYTVGTDMKVFRYFNALLLTTYTITHRLNEVGKLIEAVKEPSLGAQDVHSNLQWAECIEEVYTLATEIRQIPNQTNPRVETSHKLAVKEPPTQQQVTTPVVPVPPSFNPSQVPMSQPAQAQPVMQPQAAPQPMQQPAPIQQAPSPEDIIRGGLRQQAQMYQQPMYPQPMMPGMYPQQPMMQPQVYQQQPMMPMQQPMQPMMQQPQMYQQPMPQQAQMYQQPMMQQPQMYPQGQQVSPEQMIQNMSGNPTTPGMIPINPHLFYG